MIDHNSLWRPGLHSKNNVQRTSNTGFGRKISFAEDVKVPPGHQMSFKDALHVVSTETLQTSWTERMEAIVKSSVVIGVHGDHLMDALFMRPTPHSALLEIFPADKFVLDRERAANSVGLGYTAIRQHK